MNKNGLFLVIIGISSIFLLPFILGFIGGMFGFGEYYNILIDKAWENHIFHIIGIAISIFGYIIFYQDRNTKNN